MSTQRPPGADDPRPDEEVAAVPRYRIDGSSLMLRLLREMIGDLLLEAFAGTDTESLVADIGAGLGTEIGTLARRLAGAASLMTVGDEELASGLPGFSRRPAAMIFALTLRRFPARRRLELLRQAYAELAPGGLVLVVETLREPDPEFAALLNAVARTQRRRYRERHTQVPRWQVLSGQQVVDEATIGALFSEAGFTFSRLYAAGPLHAWVLRPATSA
jgi:hypothetical protein